TAACRICRRRSSWTFEPSVTAVECRRVAGSRPNPSLFVRRPSHSKRATELPERLRELARNDPDLVRLPVGDLGQRLNVLVGKELRIRLALVDRLEDGVDRLGLALGLEDLRLTLAFRPQDRALLLAFRLEDLRLLDAFGVQDRRALVAVGPHLLLHRFLHRCRRVDRLQLDAVDPDSPLARRLVENAAELR